MFALYIADPCALRLPKAGSAMGGEWGGLSALLTVSRRSRSKGLRVSARLRPGGRLRPLTPDFDKNKKAVSAQTETAFRNWCPRPESNRHALRRGILSLRFTVFV